MKHLYLVILFAVLSNFSGFSQSSKPEILANYETVIPVDFAPEGGISTIIDNPYSEGINTSAKVLQYKKPEGDYRLYGIVAPKIPSSEITKIEFLIYGSIQAMFFQVKTTNGSIDVDWKNSLNINGWNKFTYNIDWSSRTDSIIEILIFPDMDIGEEVNPAETYLIDNIIVTVASDDPPAVIPEVNYSWESVRIGGGGAVPTIQAHPLVENLYFMTTDVGTPYRWNHSEQRWEGMFYHTPAADWEKRGAASRIAFDPGDATGNTLYATTGGAWAINGTVLKSTDRGETWTDCQLLIDVKPNNEQNSGQLIAVDPINSDIVYVTTRSGTSVTATHGTFKNTAAGAPDSWTKINDIYGEFIQFDKSGGAIEIDGVNVCKDIFIGTEQGMYQSTDGGNNFVLMSGSPDKINRVSLHSDGTLYVTTGSGVFKWNGSDWQNITPPTSGNYMAISVNPNNSIQVVTSSSSFSPYVFNHYRSSDSGLSWTLMNKVHDNSEVPWFNAALGQATRELCWDPFNQNSVWVTDFFFSSQTTDIWADPPSITWKSRAAGHEETVNIGNLLCPPSGSNLLITSLADIGGWDHKSLTTSPEIGMVSFFPWTPEKDGGNLTGSAVQESNPDFIVRVGRAGWEGIGYSGYSADGGATYSQFKIPLGVAGGRVAVSATSETIVWVPQAGAPHRSTDRGNSWQLISSLPSSGTLGGTNVFASGPVFPLAADKVNGDKFYMYKNTGGLYVSTDGGQTFSLKGSGLPSSWITNSMTLETVPGREGNIFASSIDFGLYLSTNSGISFQKIENVESIRFLALGKGLTDVPALYVFGKAHNISNTLFRSNDMGVTWENLGVPAIGRDPLSMAADRRVYGRVFFGTGGNGYFMGSISGSDTEAPTIPMNPDSINVMENSFTLTWSASTDNVGVTEYDIYANGIYKGSTSTTTLNVTGLSCNKTYSVKVRAKDDAGNVSGESSTLNVKTASCKKVTGLTLVNADTELNIKTITNDAILDLAILPTKNLNIRANTSPAIVGSVEFELTGTETHNFTETLAPYALFGKVAEDYNSWTPTVGSYTLVATPYSIGTGNEGISLTRNFTVINSGPDGISDPASSVKPEIIVSPNPVPDNIFNLKLSAFQKESSVDLTITETTGKTVYNEIIQITGTAEQIVEIELQNINPGIYILSVTGRSLRKDLKVVFK